MSQSHQRSGFSLAEMVVAISVIGTLSLGLASAVLLTQRAAPDANSSGQRLAVAYGVLDELRADLSLAISVSELRDNAVTFLVGDRDNDGDLEKLRYEWSGTSGDALTRSVNDGAAIPLAASISEFLLESETVDIDQTVSETLTESDERLLVACEPGTGTLSTRALMASSPGVGAVFSPVLPEDASSWRITRVSIMGQTLGPIDGTFYVQIRPLNGSLPGSVALEERFAAESLFSATMEWRDFPFYGLGGLQPGAIYFLTVVRQSGAAALVLQTELNGLANHTFLVRSASTNTWSIAPTEDLAFRVYGKVVQATKPATVTRRFVNAVRARLKVGSGSHVALESRIGLVNAPEIPVGGG